MTNIIDLLRPGQDIKYAGAAGLAATNLTAAIDEVEGRLDTVETSATGVAADVADLVTLSGLAANSTDLATFTGTIIPDSSTVKGALQSLETFTENLSSLTMEFGNSVLDYVVDNTAVPATEVLGDRYILSHDGGAPNAAYDGASAGDIVEFDGTNWIATTPTVGTFISADDESNVLYYYGGTWSTKAFENTTASLGLTKVGTDIRIADASANAFSFVSGVASVLVDDTTVEITANALNVKDLGITTAKLAATSVTAAKLGSDVAGTGLSGGNGSAIDVDFGTGASQAIEGSNLASTAGAGLVGILDTGALITATTVEGALAENRTAIDAIEDNVITSANGSISSAGTVGADDQVLDVVFSTAGAANRSIEASSLASTANALGASLIGVEDSAGDFTATTVEGVLTELQDNIDAVAAGSGAWTVTTASATATANSKHAIDSTSAAVVLTLPGSPTAGQFVETMDAGRAVASNSITVARNGNLIQGVADDVVNSSVEGAHNVYVFIGGSVGWAISNG